MDEKTRLNGVEVANDMDLTPIRNAASSSSESAELYHLFTNYRWESGPSGRAYVGQVCKKNSRSYHTGITAKMSSVLTTSNVS